MATPTCRFLCCCLLVCNYILLWLILFHGLRWRPIRAQLWWFLILLVSLWVGRFRLFFLLCRFKVQFFILFLVVDGIVGIIDFSLFDLLLFRLILIHLIDLHAKLREHQLHDSFICLVDFIHLILIDLLLEVQLLFGFVRI